ncbi:arsenate reductase ArsC [Rhodanobacter sp. AS-Z3]|uniref:arsenate reductase ArsC n=1 Tax=Rhodanobacter sp. AS-Z3 TaxID=3031330 RepID=UPI002479CCB2|nr:arsenate reductase ArsC [Rhodanobacter sp. AS-Z3]WEN15697.1 arsenate reductase ArsC [Rhodanobacter sp. AS-Z3]
MYPCRVLFICTGNSARSILSEATLNHLGKGRFEAFSAGSKPTGRVNLHALEQLKSTGMPGEGFASKSWDRFADAGAPPLDIVITVCDNAANEACPVLFGDFVKAHWGLPDPAAAQGDRALTEAFRQAHALIVRRITALLQLPVETMPRNALQEALDQIAMITGNDGENA